MTIDFLGKYENCKEKIEENNEERKKIIIKNKNDR